MHAVWSVGSAAPAAAVRSRLPPVLATAVSERLCIQGNPGALRLAPGLLTPPTVSFLMLPLSDHVRAVFTKTGTGTRRQGIDLRHSAVSRTLLPYWPAVVRYERLVHATLPLSPAAAAGLGARCGGDRVDKLCTDHAPRLHRLDMTGVAAMHLAVACPDDRALNRSHGGWPGGD